MSIRAGIIVTGTEVLSGRVADRNGPWVADQLLSLGVDVGHITICGDRPDDLTAQLAFLTAQGVDLIVTTAADIAVAVTLVYLFHTTKTGFKKGDALVNKMMAFVVNTGALTAVCAVLCVVTNFAAPNTFIYVLFYMVLVRRTCFVFPRASFLGLTGLF